MRDRSEHSSSHVGEKLGEGERELAGWLGELGGSHFAERLGEGEGK